LTQIRAGNAPVSYGAFEITVGVLPGVPGPDDVLAAIADAGYEGTELGPPGYLGAGKELRERLDRHGLALVGGFVPLRFGVDSEGLDEALDLLAPYGAKPVLADAGPRGEAIAWADVQHAAERARARGVEPTFHHHMGTRVQTPSEIEELLERTDVGLLLDTGHLLAAGGDPLQGLRDWRERIDHVHLKDVRGDVLERAADWDEAWRDGAFCELGAGDVDLDAFLRELEGYAGWLVVEQDWVPAAEGAWRAQAEAQVRNRRWLAEHAEV
jgi:inosose dehydratase